MKKPPVLRTMTLPLYFRSFTRTWVSMSSSSVPMPPGRAIAATVPRRISSLRSDIVSVQTTSDSPGNATSFMKRGSTPLWYPPHLATVSDTTPMVPRHVPPETIPYPLLHSPSITFAALSLYSLGQALLAEQNIAIFSIHKSNENSLYLYTQTAA